MKVIAFFLEEHSAREMLKAFLPRFLPDNFSWQFIVFEGKQDLEKNIERKLRHWKAPGTMFVILRDQDNAVCEKVKQALKVKCAAAGHPETLVRIACRELESWYLGDLKAVEGGLSIRGLSGKQEKRKYREPDRLGNPANELHSISNGVYQKISGSRAIGSFLSPDRNKSHSFHVFISGLKKYIGSFETK